MTTTQRIAYNLFAQVVLLLLVYAALALFGAVKFLATDPLALSLPYNQVGAFGNMLLNLALLTGLLGGGLYISESVPDERLLTYTFRLWTALLIGAFFSGVLGLLEGRHMLELPLTLDIVLLIGLALFAFSIIRGIKNGSPVLLVWTFGLAISAVCTVLGLIPTSDYLLDRTLRALSVNLNLNIAYVLMALALGSWLIRRFSNAPQDWADTSLYTLAGLLTIAGVLVSLPPLYPLGGSSALGGIAVFLVPIIYLIFAAHSYRGLSDRNNTMTLAAHWYGLAVLLLLVSVGFLGGLQATPGTSAWTFGTRLTDLQSTLTAFAILAVILGVINQAAAELRQENARITGLMPFWLITFGIIGGGVVLLAAGVTQGILERTLSIGYLETQAQLTPLYALWIVGLLSTALGVAFYAMGFWFRRPAL
jgi:hypothetical protein